MEIEDLAYTSLKVIFVEKVLIFKKSDFLLKIVLFSFLSQKIPGEWTFLQNWLILQAKPD